MADRLLVLVPSRGRPENIARLVRAMRGTCRAHTHLIIGLDSDDPKLEEYPLIADTPILSTETVIQSKTRGVVAWLNSLVATQVGNWDYIGTIGDDNVPRTVGWDRRVLQSLEHQGTGFCFADDLHRGRPIGTLACHIFMTADIIRTLGYFGPPALRHMYVDNVWTAWGRETRMEYLGDVVLEHMHPDVGKAELDASYRGSASFTAEDFSAFQRYCHLQLDKDIEKIKALMKEAA